MPTNAQREEVNIGAWAAFGASLLLYHARLFWNIYRTRRRRGRPAHEHDTFFATASSLPYMMVINPAWISKMVKQSNSETSSIQAFRNTIISATFVGGFAFTQATLLLNRLDGASLGLHLTHQQVAYLVQALLLYAAFVNYLMVVRTAVHTGYLMSLVTGLPEVRQHRQALEGVTVEGEGGVSTAGANTAGAASTTASAQAAGDSQDGNEHEARMVRARGGEGTSAAPAPASVRPARHEPARFEDEEVALNTENIISRARHLIRQMSIHFTFGFRFFYFALPVSLVSAGNIPFIIGTALMIAWLFYLDHYSD